MPNDKIIRLVRYFHLSLGIFLLISVLFLNGCSSRTDGVKISWNDTSKVPASLMQLAISENTSLSSTTKSSIKFASVKGQGKRLYLFNYNNSSLCGKLGCLYTGYVDKGKNQYTRVMNLYLQPELEPNQNLISVSSDNYNSNFNLPCLDIQQLNDNHTLQKLTYCDEGGYYQAVESSFLKLPVSGSKK